MSFIDKLIELSGFTPDGYAIYLDRYAMKDKERIFRVGSLLVVQIAPPSPRRVVAEVIEVLDDEVRIRQYGEEDVITVNKRHCEVCLEETWNDTAIRVAAAVSNSGSVVRNALKNVSRLRRDYGMKITESIREDVFSKMLDLDSTGQQFYKLIAEKKFIPAGRILAGAGDPNLSPYNCMVIPSPEDSRGGIIDSIKVFTEIMARGSGCGVNISSLRPRTAPVFGVSGRSSGAVSWAGLFSNITGLIEQGGSRRGATMIIIDDTHPDLLEFINCKRTPGFMTNANLSVNVSDSFMKAVKEDGDWTLRFPDTRSEHYAQWDGNLAAWEANGYPVIVYARMKAKDIWDEIVKSAWASAEPGLWFGERSNKMSNSFYYARLVATNPCAEQALPAYGNCNLGALNLPAFWNRETQSFNWDDFSVAIYFAVKFLDNVVDIAPAHVNEIKEWAIKERRIGLNTMGLAELLIRMGIRYGSQEAVQFVDKLYGFLAETAYLSSSELASERGSFPAYSPEILNSGYLKTMPKMVRDAIAENGLRNVTILTNAPNGTTGTMIGTSTGIEPFYMFKFLRKSRLGDFLMGVSVVNELLPADLPVEDYPDYFVSAMDLTPHEHVIMQAAAQRWIDSAISKTANLPKDYTVQDVSDVLMFMYDSGCKGGTVYRDGSRSEQVLSAPDSLSEAIDPDNCERCADDTNGLPLIIEPIAKL